MVRVRLTDPKLIFAATIAGGALGGFVPVAGLTVKPVGDLYIAVLSIAIVPLMMTAVISGIGKMLRSPSLRQRRITGPATPARGHAARTIKPPG